jgi:hypothetical protein
MIGDKKTDLIYGCGILTEQPENWYHLIEAGCPDLSMRDNYRFGGDDFDDPTTNVQQRRALAIAKPISEGYWPRRSTINLTTKV